MSQIAKITAAAPEWNLADLYADRADPRIAADVDAARAANEALADLEGQFIASRAQPAALGALIDKGIGLYEQAADGLYAVSAFASLSASTARDDPRWAQFEADFRMKSAEIASKSLF
ncbi:MAG: oligoendopeptidase F, partial [Brevundimonas sp.]